MSEDRMVKITARPLGRLRLRPRHKRQPLPSRGLSGPQKLSIHTFERAEKILILGEGFSGAPQGGPEFCSFLAPVTVQFFGEFFLARRMATQVPARGFSPLNLCYFASLKKRCLKEFWLRGYLQQLLKLR